jgi:hypothetical protein
MSKLELGCPASRLRSLTAGRNSWLGSLLRLTFGQRLPERGELPVRFQSPEVPLASIIPAAACPIPIEYRAQRGCVGRAFRLGV